MVKCLADIRERVCDEVLATLSQSPPRLQNLWKSYAIVRSARQVCTKLLRIQNEGKTPKMGSAVKNVSPRRHSNLREDAGLLSPHSSVKGSLAVNDSLIVRETRPRAVTKLFGIERSEAESAARASGEAHRSEGRESADGLTAPPLMQESGNVQELLCPRLGHWGLWRRSTGRPPKSTY